MDNTLDATTLSTISLLESRLLRIEHLLYGPSPVPATPSTNTAASSLAELERRFSTLLSNFRVYADLLKIYKAHPTLFQPSSATATPPTDLAPEAVRATVLAAAPSFPATASALTAVASAAGGESVPDPTLSAALARLLPRMRGLEAAQRAQEAEAAALRARSERAVRAWYERAVLPGARLVAAVEGRVEGVERAVRRAERAREREESE